MSLAEVAERRPRALLLALAAAVAFSFQGSRGLYETTEGRYAESALEMLQSRDFLEPTLAGRPHWTKPPLAYWTIAAGVAVAGPNGWGARLGNAVVFCLTVLVVAAIGATLWGHITGVVAGLVYLSSIFPAAGAAVLSTDTLVAFWEILGVFLYLRAWRAPDGDDARRAVRLMWLVWGLAFLTKGPPALLPLLAIAAFSWLSRPRVGVLDPAGLVIFAATAASWYALVAARHPGLLGYFVADEVVGRAVTNEFGRNPQWWKPFVLYLPVLVLGQGAWLVDSTRASVRAGLPAVRTVWMRLREGGPAAFITLWIALPLAVFWAASSRLPLYVLPLYAPVALAIARALVRAHAGASLRRALSIAVPSAALLIVLKAVSAYAAPESASDMARLHRIILREAGPTADCRAFEQRKLYGLQFYREGSLRRVSASEGEPWADETLDAAIASLSSERASAHALVTNRAAAPALQAALDRAGVPFRSVAAPGRVVLVVPTRQPRVDGSAEATR